MVLSAVYLSFLVCCTSAFHQPAEQSSSVLEHPLDRLRPEKVSVPEPSEKAVRYYQSGNVLWLALTAWGLVLPSFILLTGLSAQIRNLARRWGRNWFFTIEIYAIIFFSLTYLLGFPLEYYAGYVRQHEYGISNQTFGKWLYDSVLSRGIIIAIVCLVGWIPYGLMLKSPRRWWLYTSAVLLPLIFAGAMIVPVWISPLFNRFGDMKNKDLEAKILALADRAGIEGGRVYEVDKSVDTKAVNAYVIGLLGTKRIVLWDTLLEKLPEKEVLFIMGHEMGHYVLGHLVQGILVASGLVVVTLLFVHLASGPIIHLFALRFGFNRLSDIASLPLVILLVNFALLFVMPVGLAFSRHVEHEADRFGLEITQDNAAAAKSFVALQKENLGMPRSHWFFELWRGSHPSLGDRIDFCDEYRPWETGEPLRYGYLFRSRR
jgi:Zn-dependent protease with chaperone function